MLFIIESRVLKSSTVIVGPFLSSILSIFVSRILKVGCLVRINKIENRKTVEKIT